MSNKSGVASQVISLPKGGGALQGIGETFSPDLFTGTGNFSVPIALPAGRNGFQPPLSLAYSTGNGNGPFGLGWALSVPDITRKTSKGVPRYQDLFPDPKDHDTFILSGAEDLALTGPRENGVASFRPRTEGLFARIEHVADGSNNFWRVRSKDGLISRYGVPVSEGAEAAVIANPAARSNVFCWMLSETEDTFGNRIVYSYRCDAPAGDARKWDQLYLERIQYVDFEAGGERRFLVSVSFVYDEDRPDPFSSYRSGFEIRTRFRCRRIEIRTHADDDALVRTYELSYLDDLAPGTSLPQNRASLLTEVKVVGHDHGKAQELPPLSFSYTRFQPDGRRFEPLISTSDGGTLPLRSLAEDDFETVGLYGNGLPDIVEMNGRINIWRNRGNGRFDGPHEMEGAPEGVSLKEPGVRFADMNGDGRADLLALNRSGYFPLRFGGEYREEVFIPYSLVPALGLEQNESRFMDLDGDGVTDVLRTGTEFELFLNHPREGFGIPETRPRGPLEDFPNLNFSDSRVKLGDMSGDGLQDFVLVENGNVQYWPYLGQGRWGRRIEMVNSPVIEDADLAPTLGFDPDRLQLGDVDGDGLDDLVYLDTAEDQLLVWINRGGNGWSDAISIPSVTDFAGPDAVRLADVLGVGTDGVLWTTDRLPDAENNYQFLDLTAGVKPYLLTEMNNNMGTVTHVQYASSTKFYLADQKEGGTKWKTPLPFPVHVVERVEVIDEISKGKITTEFRYHHGYWDGVEREFRGFGMVEQLDTESFERFNAPGLHGAAQEFERVPPTHFSPPTLIKTWFHLGGVDDETAKEPEIDFSEEYFEDDPPLLVQLGVSEDRPDALRTLRGTVLRTELYALDGTGRQGRPFTVTESLTGLREVEPAANPERKRIFFPHQLAERTTQWERGDDPMTVFNFTDDYDDVGQPRRQTQIACPRGWRRLDDILGERYLATQIRTDFAMPEEGSEALIRDRVARTTTFEVDNDGSEALLDLKEVADAGAGLAIIGQTLNYYDGEAFVGLPIRQLGEFGALVRSESLVLTEEILREAYHDPATPDGPSTPPYLRPDGLTSWPVEYPEEFQDKMPVLAGYTFADGSDHRARGYFAHASRVAFDLHKPELPSRGLPVMTLDPLGNETTIAYDRPYHLLPVQVTNAVGLTTSAEYDYRVLQPRMITDDNGNRRAVAFSPLGLVTSSAVMGKEDEQAGDTFESPGSRFDYDFFAFMTQEQPCFVRSTVRQHHVTETDVPLPDRNETITTLEYSDGFGRLVQTRTQAENVLFGDPIFGQGVLSQDQSTLMSDAVGRQSATDDPNVIVSGWQVYDNKGRVVEKYEPFFGTGWGYAAPTDAQRGQKATMFYDPRGQVIRTLNPDGSEQRVIHGIPADLTTPDEFAATPWEAYTYDANDFAPLSRGPEGESLSGAAPATHHFTPSSILIDALGRTTEAVVRNRNAPEDSDDPLPPIQELRTRSTYDIRGNVLSVMDTLDRIAFRYTYDFADRPWRIDSIDAGLRRIGLNAVGNETERRDSKGALLLHAYDRLQRPIRLWARDDAGSSLTLRQRMEYGDEAPDRPAMQARNLLGQLHRHHDEAGLTTVAAVDFKGNVLDKARRVIADAPILVVFDQAPANSWRVTPFQVDWQPGPQQTLAEREGELLEGTAYRTSSSVDALNRIKRLQFPEDIEGRRRVLRPQYNRAGGLEQVRLDDTLYVERIAYDAKGQRTLIAYGNGVMTRNAYDPHTFRLKRLRSESYTKPDDVTYRPTGEALQDFAYDYDLAGNIVAIRDRTPGSGILNNPEASEAIAAGDPALAQLLASGNALNRRFDYDPIYRLTSATGRECDRPPDGDPWQDQPRCTDLTKTRAYTERYRYDAVGNMLRLEHGNGSGGFTREVTLETVDDRPANNRLRRMQIGDDPYDYAFDANGNMRSEATSRHFEWNHADQMKAFRTQTDGAEPSVHAHYLYDAAGQRMKKLVRKQGGQVEVTHYIDGVFEHHRWGGDSQTGANNHVHVMDDMQRTALVRLGAAHPDDRGPEVQFHLNEHLGSSNVVVDDTGTQTRHEEYTPYGETSFGSFTRKRYRFTGMERDEESGLSYHGARYYAPWLGRWTACDPIGINDGLNVYALVRNNPVRRIDRTGHQGDDAAGFKVHGKAGYRDSVVTMDIDEPLPVGEKGLSPADARARALDLNNRQFLDKFTNRFTKYLGIEMRPGQPLRPPVSVVDNPSALITRRFGEITEMSDLFNEALAKIKNPSKLSPTKLKDKINSHIWDIIKTGKSQAATRVRTAFDKIGFENVSGTGYTLKRTPMAEPATPAATKLTATATFSEAVEIGASRGSRFLTTLAKTGSVLLKSARVAGDVGIAIPVAHRSFKAGYYLREGEVKEAGKQMLYLVPDLTWEPLHALSMLGTREGREAAVHYYESLPPGLQ